MELVPTSNGKSLPAAIRARESRVSPSQRFAFGLVVAHVFLVSSFGQHYGKLQVSVAGIDLYATELVLACVLVCGAGAFAAIPWDALTKCASVFIAIGTVWVLIGGIGDMRGPGAKAFSFFVYSLFFFFIRGFAAGEEDRWRVMRAFGLASIVGAALGFWEMQFGEGFPTSTGSLRWLPGEFALYSVLGALLAAVTALSTRRVTLGIVVVLFAAVAELILAQHRSGFVAFASALAATAALLRGSTRVLKEIVKVGAIVVIGLVAFVWFFGGSYLDETLTRIAHTTDMTDGTVAWRLLSWYEVFEGIVTQPLGHGFAVWDFSFTWEDPLLGSHNSLLDLTYRIGIPGFFAFAAMPVLFVRRTRRIIRGADTREQMLLVTTCAGLLAFLAFASFNMVLETPYMSIFFWVLLGVGAEALRCAESRNVESQATRRRSEG